MDEKKGTEILKEVTDDAQKVGESYRNAPTGLPLFLSCLSSESRKQTSR